VGAGFPRSNAGDRPSPHRVLARGPAPPRTAPRAPSRA
jgi:hypothetical protein